MGSRQRGRSARGWRLAAVALLLACGAAATGRAQELSGLQAALPPIPVGEHLTYNVRYLGIHCGVMTLTSFRDSDVGGLYHIVLEARTSSFFDGIYRVRVRIEALYDGQLDSSLTYRHSGQEKSETKEEIWQVDFEADEVRRTRDGKVKVIELDGDRVLDPLSFLFRLRRLLGSEGDRTTLPLMTSDGTIATAAEVVEKETVKTPFGKREVLVIVPFPDKDELFDKKGKIEMWVGADADRLPYRVIFDLPFGKLSAKLVRVDAHREGSDGTLLSGEEM